MKDEQSGECFRADKLLEDFIDKLIEASPTMPRYTYFFVGDFFLFVVCVLCVICVFDIVLCVEC